MKDNTDILKLRIMLAFLNDCGDCTVMGLSRTLGEKHYTVSRAISCLEKEGLISRKTKRRPYLTKAGRDRALFYSERVDTTLAFLLSSGVEVESAKSDGLLWALYNTEDTMRTIKETVKKRRIKDILGSRKQFMGEVLCRNMDDGQYKLPFAIYREDVKDGNNISMANEGFEHPCTLSIVNGSGILQLRYTDMSARSQATGKIMTGHVKYVKYFDSGRYINADKNGDILSIPASSLTFKNIGKGLNRVFHGMVSLKMECTVGEFHMPEATAIFTLFI